MRVGHLFASVVSVGCLSLFSASVGAQVAPATERPRGIYIPVDDPTAVPLGTARAGESLLIYMNRSGGTFYPANQNDSSNNYSSIINNTINMPAYPYGDASWGQVMDCMREIFGPFNIAVTDVDPGAAQHIECITSGSPGDAGFGNGVGGVSPYSCGYIQRSIVYDFAEVWGNDPRTICETAAQEIAHSFGLDHEHYCPDPMTYIFNCGNKLFRDYNAPCGEDSNRSCNCTGAATQNSYQEILAQFGPRASVPPEVAITNPANNATVQAGFVVNVNAVDDVGIDRVELWIDGAMVGNPDQVPDYGFLAPSDLAGGSHTIVARAVDGQGLITDSTAITVNLTGPCGSNDDCSDAEVCDTMTGNCVPGPNSDNGLGHVCVANEDCASGVCISIDGNMVCSQNCDVAAPSCPDGFDCNSGYCVQSTGGGGGSGGCGCQAASKNGSLPLVWLGLGLVGLVAVRRRRRK